MKTQNKPVIPEGADDEEAAQIEQDFQDDMAFKRKHPIKPRFIKKANA